MEEFLKKIKESFEVGEPIFTNEILALFDLSRQRVMELLKKSIDNGDIKKIERGVYYIPKYEKGEIYGYKYETDNAPNYEEIIDKKYRRNKDGNIYGIDDGMVLENRLHLTSQVPSVHLLVSNNTKKKYNKVKILGEEVEIRKPYTKITKDNYREYEVLQVLNVLKNVRKYEIERLKEDIKKEHKNKRVMRELLPYFPKRVQYRVKKYEVL